MSSFFIIKNALWQGQIMFLENSPARFSSQIPRTFFEKNEKVQKITNMLRTSLTLDTENKNLGMVMKYFLTRLTNLNCNFILTESVRAFKHLYFYYRRAIV